MAQHPHLSSGPRVGGPVLTWDALQQTEEQGRPPVDPPHLGRGGPAARCPQPAARRRPPGPGPQVTRAAALGGGASGGACGGDAPGAAPPRATDVLAREWGREY